MRNRVSTEAGAAAQYVSWTALRAKLNQPGP